MAKIEQRWFSSWLKRAWPFVHKAVTAEAIIKLIPLLQALVVSTGLGGVLYLLWFPKIEHQKHYFFFVNDVGHIIVLLLLWFVFLNKLEIDLNRSTTDPTSRTVAGFKASLFGLVLVWIAYFLVQILLNVPSEYAFQLDAEVALRMKFIARILNLSTALGFFGMYAAVSRADPETIHQRVLQRLFSFIMVIAPAVALEVYLFSTAQQATFLGYVGGVLNGLIVGFTMCLLIGRLDSRYLEIPGSIIKLLYGYALIQCLLPFVFREDQQFVDLSERAMFILQQAIVFSALLLKSCLIISLGKLIDSGSLHFYISNMAWLERHVSRLRVMHFEVLQQDGLPRGGPPLHALTPPGRDTARLRLTPADIKFPLTIINGWIGIDWIAENIRVSKVTIGETTFKPATVKLDNRDSRDGLHIKGSQRFTEIDVIVDLDHDRDSLLEVLRKDPKVAAALTGSERKINLQVSVAGLELWSIVSELPDARHRWQAVVPLGGSADLSYQCPLHLSVFELPDQDVVPIPNLEPAVP